ncbi:MAG TPA: thermonuclease family protein [Planctomycetota bacterium]|nr:thermonuclease family protein [Planctomycetota bacterium]
MRAAFAGILFVAGFAAGWLVCSFAAKPGAKPTVDLSVSDGGVYRVRKVVDGDTIVLENGVHVRYNGINSPEMGHFVADRAPLAAEATARNIALVEGKQVRLKLASQPLDMHGRVCARVFLSDESPGKEREVGLTLVKEGLARANSLGLAAEEYNAFKALETDAKLGKLGIWGLEEKLRGTDGKESPYCGASSGGKFHLRECGAAKRIRPENMHFYSSQQEAEAAGREACSKCILK